MPMLKPILGLAATGVAAFLLSKLLLVVLLPLVGVAVGFVLLVVKIVFWVCAAVFAIWLIRRWSREPAGASA